MCPGVALVLAALGPTSLRQQVQLNTIWQLTPVEDVIQVSGGRVKHEWALKKKKSQPLAEEETKNSTEDEEVVESEMAMDEWSTWA